MNLNKLKIKPFVEFQFFEIFFNGLFFSTSFLFKSPKNIINLFVTDVHDFLFQKLLHAYFIEVLESVHQVKIIIISNTFPVKIKVIFILFFIDNFTEKQVHKYLKGIFTARNIMFSENGSELVVFTFFVGSIHNFGINFERVFIFSNLIGLDIFLKKPFFRKF